ncbi:23S rRNA (adenine(2503)-C(2))-methyltransferase RlmN [Adlercreutzia equolifaciens]|uniref:23S rRNA (adenine(2503)-C(2))-methyltransferase RlmN n=1 Tax=Adlercreutzia equolifaciens TaxID=446660 RepID=UPI0023B01CE7|nr:23S rRNA (adenine(2503)-C(2))-methyltransferase RlmN [Adlercreutzia equolifaciens]MDE8701621.1 23S rRNA (adenine(2503)-C(2))-methyltransferase RlmN [Adlercreutzia equolifaciens]
MNNELFTYSANDLGDLMESWGQPKFRGKQIHEWLHRHHVTSYDQMTNIPATLRYKLSQEFPSHDIEIAHKALSCDGSRKYLVRLSDGCLVETVGLPELGAGTDKGRLSVCVSSQVGCPMECAFCATGREGLTRNLTAQEIVQQAVAVQHDFGRRVSNVVVMGQGEPFLNYDEVIKALRILNSKEDLNIGARHITLSTCGIIEGINKLSDEPEQFTLAVSLHSAIPLTRDALMPRVSSQPLDSLKEALSIYNKKTGRRVSLEYLLLKDVNDDEAHLEALINFCRGLLCHVNLLPMNAVEGATLQPSTSRTMKQWLDRLNREGIETTARVSRGSDIDGACGQLKNSTLDHQ